MARAPAFQAGYAGSIPVTRSMRAVVMESMGQPLVAVDLPDPTPNEGEVVVAVDACGICGSDLHAAVHLPLDGTVLGHEFCGTVVDPGRSSGTIATGSRVVGLSLVTCGECDACRSGRIRKCALASMVGFERPGAFAEFVTLPESSLLPLPEPLDHRHGALAEPLAVARRAVYRSAATPGSTVVVLGAGPVGLAATLWLAHLGAASIVVSDPVAARRDAAMRAGATATIDPTAGDTAGAIAELCGGAPRHVIECVGIPGLLDQAIAVAGVDATVSVAGVCMEPETVTPILAMVKELDLRFSFFYTRQDMQAALDEMAAGRLDPTGLVTDEVGLDALPEKFRALLAPGGGPVDTKVLVRPRQDSNLRPSA